MGKSIAMIGAFDTKGEEYAFLRERIVERGHEVVAIDTGVLAATGRFHVIAASKPLRPPPRQ